MTGGIVSVIGCMIWLTRPVVIRSHKNSDLTEAVSNARQIGLALFQFETEYGRFPDAALITELRRKTKTHLNSEPKSSNDFFRQLLASGIAGNEEMFYAKIAGVRKPDGVIAGSRALEKGEVGFSYLAGLQCEGNPSQPLVVTPLIPGTDRFDPTRFGGKAIVLRMDNSVSSMTIGKGGRVIVNGKNLLDPTNPVWGTNKWTLVWPE